MRFLWLLLLITGCASEPYWVKDPDWVLKETVILRVDSIPWPDVQGWAIRDKKTGVCQILILRNVDNYECVLEHEKKHCDGYDHPKFPRHLGCSFSPLMRM
jgi:hypothetical protein